MSTAVLLGQSVMSNPLFWAGGIVVTVVVIAFMFIILLAKQYKRCPSNRVLVIYGRTGKGQSGDDRSWRRRLRHSLDPRLRVHESRADPDRDSACGAPCRSKTSASTCPACSRWPSAPNRRSCSKPRSACWACRPSRFASRPKRSSSAFCDRSSPGWGSKRSIAIATSSCSRFRCIWNRN